MFEKLKKFIEDNKILTRKELQNNYPYKYKLFCKLSNEEKDKLISVQDPSKYSSLRTVEDFQKYIDENNIESNEDFYTNYASVYGKCRKVLSKEERLSLKFKIMINHNDWSSFKTLSDFQNFIDCHKIKSNKEFVKNFPGLYNKYIHTLSKEKRLLKFSPRKEPFSELIDFQKYIDENNINSRKDFKNNRSLESRYYKVVPKEERYLVFKNEVRHLYNKEFSTIKDFQKFINERNIIRPVDFKKRFPKIYDRFCRVISKEDKKKIIYKNKTRSYSDINSIDKLQDFIKENDVINKKELHKSFPGLYVKFQDQLDNVTFNESGMSQGEHFLMKLFIDNNIKFITQKTYSDLKNKLPLRYDFFLPEFNILIEHHGEGHFGKGRYYTQELIDNDKIKYKYAIDNNITIIYYTIYKSEYLNNGYFTEVITDPEILINRILG